VAFSQLILASLRRQKNLYLLWIVSLCAAVSGLVIVDVFRQSLMSTLLSEGRKILSADVAISARRALTNEEMAAWRKVLPPLARTADLTEMYAMVTLGKESRLAHVRFISENYPLVGDLRDENGAALEKCGCAAAAGDLFALMNAKPGDAVKVGAKTFVLKSEIKKDSSQTFRFGNMAPRIYLPLSSLKETGLVQYGSTMSEVHFATLPKPVPDLKAQLEAALSDAAVNVTVPADLEQGTLRVMSRLLDFLGLTGLITLSLGWIGVYYLGRRWLALEQTSCGILKCLGFSSTETRRLLLTKLLLILIIGIVLGGILAWAAANAMLPFLSEALPAEFRLVWSWRSTLLLLIIGPLAGWLLLYQAVRDLADEKPLALFQERVPGRPVDVLKLFVLIGVVALLFLALTYLQARSWKITGAFIGALGGSVLFIALLSYGFLLLVQHSRTIHRNWMPHLISALWVRRRASSLLLIIVSALAGLLSQLLPHLERTLVGELNSPMQDDRPAVFMVDIQDDQLDPLKKFLDERHIAVAGEAPFVRARIMTVNGRPFERAKTGEWSTREEENDARFRNRGVNLTYRKELSESESIVAGKAWKDLSVDPPEIAVEESYAERLKLKLGDELKFDIQGVELSARIASLRAIRWNAFTPNFFIQFPDGVLNEAPKTWVMAVKASQNLVPTQIQTLVTKEFPNVTSINVVEVVTNMRDMLEKLSAGLKISSRLSLALGVFVFLMIILFQLLSAQNDWRQLLVLGLTHRQVWLMQVTGYGLLCLIGTWIGALMSLAVAWALFSFGFDMHVRFDFTGMLFIWLWTWGAVLAGFAAVARRARVAGLDTAL
jgi:putative ABC transport system permease protein